MSKEMNKKELLIEVYSEPLIQELLDQGFMTKEQLIEFVLHEEEPTPEEEEVGEPTDAEKESFLVKASAWWQKTKGTAEEKIEQLKKLAEPGGAISNWISAENPVDVHYSIKKRIKAKKTAAAGDPSLARLPSHNLKSIPTAISLSINAGVKIWKAINEMDEEINWGDRDTRSPPVALVSATSDDTAETDKINARIAKYEEMKFKLDSFEKSVRPQVRLENGEPIGGTNETNIVWFADNITLVAIEALEKSTWETDEPDPEKPRPTPYQTVENIISLTLQNKTPAQSIKDLNLGAPWDQLDNESLKGIFKFVLHANKLSKNIEKEISGKAGSEKPGTKTLKAHSWLKSLLGYETTKPIKELRMFDFFPVEVV